MNIKQIGPDFFTTGQITQADVAELAKSGFKGIVCARPDAEEPSQPAFASIATAARENGLKAFHIPVSGPLTEGQIIRFEQAMAELDGPVLGYCRSGARAGSLYSALQA
jgi:uncharacterized protein (TIGR01244 family)